MTALQNEPASSDQRETEWHEDTGPRPGGAGAWGVCDRGDHEDDHRDQEQDVSKGDVPVEDSIVYSKHEATVDPTLGEVKPPPYDDSLMPALWLLAITALFAALLIGFLWLNQDWGDFTPTPSTLPALTQK